MRYSSSPVRDPSKWLERLKSRQQTPAARRSPTARLRGAGVRRTPTRPRRRSRLLSREELDAAELDEEWIGPLRADDAPSKRASGRRATVDGLAGVTKRRCLAAGSCPLRTSTRSSAGSRRISPQIRWPPRGSTARNTSCGAMVSGCEVPYPLPAQSFLNEAGSRLRPVARRQGIGERSGDSPASQVLCLFKRLAFGQAKADHEVLEEFGAISPDPTHRASRQRRQWARCSPSLRAS